MNVLTQMVVLDMYNGELDSLRQVFQVNLSANSCSMQSKCEVSMRILVQAPSSFVDCSFKLWFKLVTQCQMLLGFCILDVCSYAVVYLPQARFLFLICKDNFHDPFAKSYKIVFGKVKVLCSKIILLRKRAAEYSHVVSLP
jgi:hypothetical protein